MSFTHMGTSLRAFLAIELDQQLRERINSIQSQMKESGADVKWVAVSNMHLTLKFLGDTQQNLINLIKKNLKAVCFSHRVFEIEIAEIGGFPSLSKPRIVWVGLKDNPPLNRLAEAIEQKLNLLGISPSDKPFHGHNIRPSPLYA